MTDERSSTINRRNVIKSVGASGIVGLAGCSGDGGSGGGSGGSSGGGSGGSSGGGSGGGSGGATTTESKPFPQQDITFVIPYGPGGGYDAYVRALAKEMPKYLDGPGSVVPQNVDGAGGRIAMRQVYNSEPDGYTITAVNGTSHPRMQVRFEDIKYDLNKVSWLGQIVSESRNISVAKHTGIDTFDQYVEAVANEELTWYSTGPGSNSDIVPAVVGAVGDLYPPENVLNNKVVYGGKGEGIKGVIAGDIDAMSAGYYSIVEYEQYLKPILFITTDEHGAPPRPQDVATLTTAEVPNAQAIVGMAGNVRLACGPPGIPDNRLSALQNAFKSTLTNEEFKTRMREEVERPVKYASPEQAKAIATGAVEQWQNRTGLLEDLFGQASG